MIIHAPLLREKITVECPRLGKTVNVRQCLGCPHFSHISYRGVAVPWIACRYARKEPEPTARLKPETEEAEKRKKEAEKTGLDMFLS